MQQMIQQKLDEIEQTHRVKILFAIESGSRAWGFPSKDSDYDVRFVYLQRPQDYLSIEKKRDVIEYPVTDLLDVNGWDLRKALGLLRKYNPSLMEWLDSPIVYREQPTIRQELREIRSAFFGRRTALHHYLSMAASNYRDYLKGETVKAKKYFYVLRPILACLWLQRETSQPPLEFQTLLATQLADRPDLTAQIEALLERKIAGGELDLEARLDDLNQFIETSLRELTDYARQMPSDPVCELERLNELFRAQLKTIWGFR
ncbi:nucleotidyltransferase domain-containing protein [Azotosporobacter soli]|uniref:nucleotidyltransferase domain-containing protein n=1 Tax=Azotosporobacter soli TaxID=3055040 RepID=UPI0031FF3186